MSANSQHINECPVCRSPLIFQAPGDALITCNVCNSSINRKDGQMTISSIPVIKKDDRVGLVRTGLSGKWKNVGFKIVGRLRCEFQAYSSNRWTIIFFDGKNGVLVETPGFWAIGTEIIYHYPSRVQQLNSLDLGNQTTELIKGAHTSVFSKATCTGIEVEGEVFSAVSNKDFKVYELAGNIEERIEIVEMPYNKFECRKLEYTTLSSLELNVSVSSLQNNPGILIGCANCGKSSKLLVPEYSVHFVCTHCKTWNVIDKKGNASKKDFKFGKFTPAFPVGTKGNVFGKKYEVVGITQKSERGAMEFKWREYTLYNLENGYAFLSEFNGHWIYLKEIKSYIPWPDYGTEIFFKDNSYLLYNDYQIKVLAAEGEFPVSLNTANIHAKEYISPQKMILLEKEPGLDVTLYEGIHVDPKELATFMSVPPETLPQQSGIGALQPMKYRMDIDLLRNVTLIAIAVFFIVQGILSSRAKEETVFTQQSYGLSDSAYAKGISTPSFELPAAKSNLRFTFMSPVSNSWFEAAITMVNDKTGEEFSLEKGVEFYSGYSDGEKWEEGSTRDEVVMSSIPAGKYHLNIFPSFDTGSSNRDFTITVTNDVPMWRNFFIIISILLLYPGIQWLRYAQFERRRWNGSENSPYNKSDD